MNVSHVKIGTFIYISIFKVTISSQSSNKKERELFMTCAFNPDEGSNLFWQRELQGEMKQDTLTTLRQRRLLCKLGTANNLISIFKAQKSHKKVLNDKKRIYVTFRWFLSILLLSKFFWQNIFFLPLADLGDDLHRAKVLPNSSHTSWCLREHLPKSNGVCRYIRLADCIL